MIVATAPFHHDGRGYVKENNLMLNNVIESLSELDITWKRDESTSLWMIIVRFVILSDMAHIVPPLLRALRYTFRGYGLLWGWAPRACLAIYKIAHDCGSSMIDEAIMDCIHEGVDWWSYYGLHRRWCWRNLHFVLSYGQWDCTVLLRSELPMGLPMG